MRVGRTSDRCELQGFGAGWHNCCRFFAPIVISSSCAAANLHARRWNAHPFEDTFMKPDMQMIGGGAARLRVAIQGTGPLIVLIHGFPESWYSWRHQITALANAGYRVAAPDVRGYGGSDKPDAIEAYSIKDVCAD